MEISLAVNLSARSLSDDKLVGQLSELLESSRVAPECLTMEVTESGVMANPERAARILERLRGLGFGLSIDDFGTGYSSLNYVRTLPACELKLDRSFVRDIDTNTSNAAIVRAVVDLAHGLGLKVVAEGVETRADADAVRALGCDQMQGYYVSRPLPATDFERFFQAYPESAVAQHLRAAPKSAEIGKPIPTGPSAPPPGLRESLRLVRR
jgi:EAL domain-containing protein (putative c-di-GMP-specific phosphodiesterase class I)